MAHQSSVRAVRRGEVGNLGRRRLGLAKKGLALVFPVPLGGEGGE